MGELSDPKRLETLRATGLLDSPAEESFDRITRLAADVLDVPVVLMSLVDDMRQYFKSMVGFTKEPWASTRQTPLTHSFCQHVVVDERLLAVSDARLHPLVRDNLAIRDLDVIAYAGVPLVTDHHTIGALCVIDRSPRQWSERDLRVLNELALCLMTEMEFRAALQTVRRTEVELREQKGLLESVLETMEDAVIVSDGAGQALVFNAAARKMLGRGPTDLPPESWSEDYGLFLPDGVTRLQLEDTPLWRALRGETTRQREIFVRGPHAQSGQWHSVNAVPLRDAAGVVFGGITVGRDVTDLRHAQDALRDMSLKDDLTGLLNRRGFMEHGNQQLRLAARSKRPLTLFYADLNDMKPINDVLGHAAGDAALRAIGGVLRATFRESDLVGRLGGDEFAVLALDSGTAAANASSERLRANVETLNTSGVHPFRLSVSVGASTYDPEEARTLDALLVEADRHMYEKKMARRIHGSSSMRAVRVQSE